VADIVVSDGDDNDNDDSMVGQDDPKDEDEPLPRFILIVADVEASGKASSEMIIPDRS
jgi:hypothetical protein